MASGRVGASELVASLFECRGQALFRYARRATGSSAIADDIVQEVFASLYRDLCLGKLIENPTAYVFGAARNQVCKHARQESQRGEVLLAPEVLEAMCIPAESVGAPAELDEVRALFSVLSEREEAVIELRLQSLKYREIADQLGISPKTVATLLARAIRKLQSALKSASGQQRNSSMVTARVPKTLQ